MGLLPPPVPPTRRTVWFTAALALVIAVLVMPSAGARADDPYTGSFDVQCTVQIEVGPGSGARMRAVVDADVVGNVAPRGRVSVVFSLDGERVGSASARYSGQRVVLEGPPTSAAGRYQAAARFTPDSGSRFTPCTASDAVRSGVLGEDGTATPDPDPDDEAVEDGVGSNGATTGPSGGLLPDAGGPMLALVLLGLLLVALGSVLLRRRAPGSVRRA